MSVSVVANNVHHGSYRPKYSCKCVTWGVLGVYDIIATLGKTLVITETPVVVCLCPSATNAQSLLQHGTFSSQMP